jgi:hypothetical protein
MNLAIARLAEIAPVPFLSAIALPLPCNSHAFFLIL